MSSTGPLTSSLPHLEYLLPRMEAFWRWSDDGQAIEWRDGRTIAFREEILAVLRRLAPSGLPTFGAIVLLLAATRDNWNEASDKIDRIFAGYSITKDGQKPSASNMTPVMVSLTGVIPHRARQELTDVLGDLEAVASLPAELRTSTAAKAMLAEMVFDGAPGKLNASASAAVVELMDGGIDAEMLRRIAGWDEQFQIFAHELDVLQRGLGRVAAEPLSLWMATGLDRIVTSAELELPPAQRVRGLIKDLQEDAALAGFAKVARDLLAAIHVPRVLISPEDLPVGGVSDISNRGPLDRLLLSELAQEDLTLVIRVALGEALYLRRESPAQHPPIGRAILVDCGIRMWGVPRLYATAVGMALIAMSDVRGSVSVHRSRASLIEPADLLSRSGVMTHLTVLDPAPQPGEALELFRRAADSVQNQQIDLYIVTHERVLEDPQFQRRLRRDPSREWHVATVCGDGTFDLWLIGPAGRRRLCRAMLSLDELLAEPKAKVQPPPLTVGTEFPEIERLPRFPLLLPAKVKVSCCATSTSGQLIGTTGDRRLMHWENSVHCGGRQVLSRLPKGKVLRVLLDEQNWLAHVIVHRGEHQKLHIVSADLHATGDSQLLREQSIDLHRQPAHMMCSNGWILLFLQSEMLMISSTRGEIRKLAIPSGMNWKMGRYLYQYPNGWYAITQEGFQFLTKHAAKAVFDRGRLGPWLMLRNGEVVPSDEAIETHEKGDSIWTFLGASDDGERIFARMENPPKARTGIYRYSFEQKTWVPAFNNENYIQARLLSNQSLPNEPFNIRNRFRAIDLAADGALSLFNRYGHIERLSYFQDGQITLLTTRTGETFAGKAAFCRAAAPEGVRYSMRLAQWADGSRAYLDSRGLLHLISSDPKLPQMTLALTTGPIAAWTTAGQRIGAAYFFNEKANATGSALSQYLQDFARRLG